MRNLAVIMLLSLSLHDKVIICDTICKQDGDEKGILLGENCYCANKRDIKKVIFKINRDFKGDISITPEKKDYE